MSNNTLPAVAPDGGTTSRLAVSATFIALAVITVALRFYARIATRLGVWWDDILVLAAVIITIPTAVLLLEGIHADPTGYELAQLSGTTDPDPGYVYTPEDQEYLKFSMIAAILYFSIAGATNMGILLMYYRLFKSDTSFRYQLYGVSAIVVAFWMGATAASLASCIPLSVIWTQSPAHHAACYNFDLFWMITGVIEIVINILVLALPVRVLIKLQMSVKKKISIAGLFLLGGFVIVTGVIRVILAYNPHSTAPSFTDAMVWTMVHIGMAIVCASLPILKPLFVSAVSSSIVHKSSSTST